MWRWHRISYHIKPRLQIFAVIVDLDSLIVPRSLTTGNALALQVLVLLHVSPTLSYDFYIWVFLCKLLRVLYNIYRLFLRIWWQILNIKAIFLLEWVRGSCSNFRLSTVAASLPIRDNMNNWIRGMHCLVCSFLE